MVFLSNELPNQKNIYCAALALIAIMYGITQGIIAVASLLATMALSVNDRNPQECMSGVHNMSPYLPCCLGIRIQPTFAVARVVRVD